MHDKKEFISYILCFILLFGIGAAGYKMVVGPTSTTNNSVSLWDGPFGNKIKNSSIINTNIGLLDAEQVWGGDNTFATFSPGVLTAEDYVQFRDALGAAIGTNVLAYNSYYATIAGGNGSELTSLDGTAFSSGTINTSKMDSGTVSLFGDILPGTLDGDQPIWNGSAFTPRTSTELTVDVAEDFLLSTVNANLNWDGTLLSGGGANTKADPTESGVYGQAYQTAGSAETNSWTVANSLVTAIRPANTDLLLIGGRFKLLSLSSATEPFFIEHGFNNKNTVGDPTDSIALQINTNVFSLVTRSNSIETLTNSTVTFETNIWWDWMIVADLSVPSAVLYAGTNIANMKANPIVTNTLNLPIGRTLGIEWYIAKVPGSSGNVNTIYQYLDNIWAKIYGQ